MAKSPDHYKYNDLILDLRKIGKNEVADSLAQYDEDIRKLGEERSFYAQKVLRINLEALTPHLRPCHKKQGKELTVYTWMYV